MSKKVLKKSFLGEEEAEEKENRRTVQPGPGRDRSVVVKETRPGPVVVPGIGDNGLTIEEGYDEQSTIASNKGSTAHIYTRTVDTVKENQRLCALDQAVHEQDRMHPQMLDNAPIVPPVTVTKRDVENGDEGIDTSHDDLAGSDEPKRGLRGWQWFAMGAILLIVVAVAVTLALVLPSEPNTPGPTALAPNTQEPTTIASTAEPTSHVPNTEEPTTIAPTPPQDPLSALLSSASSDGGAALADPSTAQNKAFKWIAEDPNLANYTDQEKIQRYALATFYYATKGDSWINNTNWLFYEPVCGNWYSNDFRNDDTINCTTDGISDLLLYDNNLQGSIPPEIGMLSNSLEELWLDNNALEGDIPTEMGKLTKLNDLTLWNNSLIGTIPNELGLLTKLAYVSLHLNGFTGTLPTSLASLTLLQSLHLWNNSLIGNIPSELGLLTKLTELYMSDNGFTGTVPTSLASLTLLDTLVLSNNDLTGSFDFLCGIGIEMFAANDCGEEEIICTCCTACCGGGLCVCWGCTSPPYM